MTMEMEVAQVLTETVCRLLCSDGYDHSDYTTELAFTLTIDSKNKIVVVLGHKFLLILKNTGTRICVQCHY